VNGGTAVTGEVVPSGGFSAIQIRSEDAGGVFRSANILRKAYEGNITLTLTGREEGFWDTLDVMNTRVKDGSAIAALLNSVSLVCLIDEMAGQGNYFSRVSAQFALTSDRVTVYESSAEGPSIGSSMDGIYNLSADRLNMQGVLTPAYLINGVGRVLTRPGEGLFGFTYTLIGLASNPSVLVNPLSVLTPGLLREVFREAPPQEDGVPERRRRQASERPGEDC